MKSRGYIIYTLASGGCGKNGRLPVRSKMRLFQANMFFQTFKALIIFIAVNIHEIIQVLPYLPGKLKHLPGIFLLKLHSGFQHFDAFVQFF